MTKPYAFPSSQWFEPLSNQLFVACYRSAVHAGMEMFFFFFPDLHVIPWVFAYSDGGKMKISTRCHVTCRSVIWGFAVYKIVCR